MGVFGAEDKRKVGLTSELGVTDLGIIECRVKIERTSDKEPAKVLIKSQESEEYHKCVSCPMEKEYFDAYRKSYLELKNTLPNNEYAAITMVNKGMISLRFQRN